MIPSLRLRREVPKAEGGKKHHEKSKRFPSPLSPLRKRRGRRQQHKNKPQRKNTPSPLVGEGQILLRLEAKSGRGVNYTLKGVSSPSLCRNCLTQFPAVSLPQGARVKKGRAHRPAPIDLKAVKFRQCFANWREVFGGFYYFFSFASHWLISWQLP